MMSERKTILLLIAFVIFMLLMSGCATTSIADKCASICEAKDTTVESCKPISRTTTICSCKDKFIW